MPQLSDNWITEKHIDFEYKKYVLLAYFQEVNRDFNVCKLYPMLSDLLMHYKNALSFKENKTNISDGFPKKLTSVDVEQLHLQYERLLNDDVLMKEIESIIRFSLPKFKYFMEEGKKIYDFIEDHLTIMPVGVVPLHLKEGYLMLKDANVNNIKVYQYSIKLYNTAESNYRTIYTEFVDEYSFSYSNTFENIKIHLLKIHKEWPNPATYAINTDLAIPLEETYLPIAKRMLIRYIAKRVD